MAAGGLEESLEQIAASEKQREDTGLAGRGVSREFAGEWRLGAKVDAGGSNSGRGSGGDTAR